MNKNVPDIYFDFSASSITLNIKEARPKHNNKLYKLDRILMQQVDCDWWIENYHIHRSDWLKKVQQVK